MVTAIRTPLPTVVIKNAATLAPARLRDRGARRPLSVAVGARSSANTPTNAAAHSGMLIANTPRQFVQAISTPPMTGPSAVAEADTDDHTPSALARAASSAHKEVNAARLAGSMAAAPSPCKLREASRTRHDGARQQPIEPARNTLSPTTSIAR